MMSTLQGISEGGEDRASRPAADRAGAPAGLSRSASQAKPLIADAEEPSWPPEWGEVRLSNLLRDFVAPALVVETSERVARECVTAVHIAARRLEALENAEAAAPELLEALEAARDFIETLPVDQAGHGLNALAKIDRALSQARQP